MLHTLTKKTQELQGPPARIHRRLRSHGLVTATALMAEAYVADTDECINIGRAEQYGLAVGDLRVEATDPSSLEEAGPCEDGEVWRKRARQPF